jgi:hypothetical protein
LGSYKGIKVRSSREFYKEPWFLLNGTFFGHKKARLPQTRPKRRNRSQKRHFQAKSELNNALVAKDDLTKNSPPEAMA